MNANLKRKEYQNLIFARNLRNSKTEKLDEFMEWKLPV